MSAIRNAPVKSNFFIVSPSCAAIAAMVLTVHSLAGISVFVVVLEVSHGYTLGLGYSMVVIPVLDLQLVDKL
jgi:hypothetical protein